MITGNILVFTAGLKALSALLVLIIGILAVGSIRKRKCGKTKRVVKKKVKVRTRKVKRKAKVKRVRKTKRKTRKVKKTRRAKRRRRR